MTLNKQPDFQEEKNIDHFIHIDAIDMLVKEILGIKERMKNGEKWLANLLQIREGELSVEKIRAIISWGKF